MAVWVWLIWTVTAFAASEPKVVNQYISCGDNWFMGQSMAIDSPKAINDAFDFFKDVYHSKRIYWRGLQSAMVVDQMVVREDNFMVGGFLKYTKTLMDVGVEEQAVEIAHRKGLEIYGVTQLGDYGNAADTPGFNDYPSCWEARLRLEHPEWVPVDKYGYRKQGGVIELAYPEARRALVNLYVKLVRDAGYDGVTFMTYSENFSMRFQDEFGFSDPIVTEFKRRHKIDIRSDEFNKFGSREDWYRLRGEYVTAFFRELREALGNKVKLSVFVNPINPVKPMVWATLNQEFYTLGMMKMDVHTWVKEGIVDELSVYGAASAEAQNATLEELLFLCRGTKMEVTYSTSSPHAERWKQFIGRASTGISALGEDVSYLNRSELPEQSAQALVNGNVYEKMKFLSQLVEGHVTCSTDLILPLLKDKNVILRRLSLQALGRLHVPSVVPEIERALDDEEQGVRAMAIAALGENQRPESFDAIARCMEKFGNHHLLEMTKVAIPKFKPVPYERLQAALKHHNVWVRRMAAYSLSKVPRVEDLPHLVEALQSEDRHVRYLAATALGMPVFGKNEAAHRILLNALAHSDHAIQDRAAVSLGELGSRGYAGPLRAEMLQALRMLFLEMGEKCQRSDREWGYRSVGNALLGFGSEGEAVLHALKNSGADLRIQELAWRVLSFREKTVLFANGNAFNIITEETSDAAFLRRPFALKAHNVDRIVQSFDDASVFPEPLNVTVGDANTPGARWGGFNSKGPSLDSAVSKSGRRSLKLKGGGGSLLGWSNKGVVAGADFGMEMWIHRNPKGAFVSQIRDKANQDVLRLFVDSQGNLSLGNPDGGTGWSKTNLSVPPDLWVKLTLTEDVASGTCVVKLVDENHASLGEVTVLAPPCGASPDRLSLAPQGASNSEVHLDDVRLFEIR